MKVAYVTVRYGPMIMGGAEQACRQLATHLAAAGDAVSVYTTCAVDSVTWANETAPGTTVEDGVAVHRFPCTGRDPHFEDLSSSVLADPGSQPADVEQRWLEAQGPVCPAAVDAAVASDADLVIATPYLYWPTVATARAARGRLVMHPAAHDEPPIRLPVFTEVFGSAIGLAFFTDGERRLVERLWPSLSATPQMVVGVGVSGPPLLPDGFDAVDGRPYVLCLGRVDEGKGTAVLARFFTAYKRRHPGPLALVFAGPVVHDVPDHPDIITTGALGEDTKWAALAGCQLLINPSANESFSIVLLEAWASGRPALVNARCAATAEHMRRSQAGATFGGYAGFEAALDHLLGNHGLMTAMGLAGREYVERGFAWPVVMDRYRRWLQHLVQ